MGWARANLLYDTISSPPAIGSLKEAVCVLVQQGRADQDFFRTAAMLSEQGSEARITFFESYKQALLPYMARVAAQRQAHIKEILDEAYAQGPISIRHEE